MGRDRRDDEVVASCAILVLVSLHLAVVPMVAFVVVRTILGRVALTVALAVVVTGVVAVVVTVCL